METFQRSDSSGDPTPATGFRFLLDAGSLLFHTGRRTSHNLHRPLATGHRPPANGFTLIEILLTLVIVGLIAGALILNFSGLIDHRRFTESGVQFETLIRMSRAQALNLGKRFAIHADPDTGAVSVLWEPDPLANPGTFVPYTDASWPDLAPNEVLKITLSHPGVDPPASTDPNAPSPSAPDPSMDASAGTGRSDIVFQPDGTCDSSTVELAGVQYDDGTRIHIEIQGVTGQISSEIRHPTDSNSSGSGPPPSPGPGN